MKKQFTYKIPDELYVNSFEKNLSYSGTYDGPDKLYVLVEDGGFVTRWGTSPTEEIYNSITSKEIELDPKVNPEVAFYLTQASDMEYVYTFTETKNPDGSIYNELANPKLKDYYWLVYHDNDTHPWEFRLITKAIESGEEATIKENLAFVKQYSDKYSFDATNQKIIDTYIKNAEAYLNEVANYKPWKFVKFPSDNAPKLPVTLVTLFKSLDV